MKKQNILLIAAASLVIIAVYALEKTQLREFLQQSPTTQEPIFYHENTDHSRLLFDNYGNPSESLQALLKLTNIKHDGSLQSIVDETQKQWLRAAGKERWEIDELYPEKRKEALEILDTLGCVDEVKPTHTHYDYAVILGATVQRFRTRLGYLVSLHNQGIEFKNIIMLGSKRPLDDKIENSAILLDGNNGILACKPEWKLQGSLPKTETEMMKMVYSQAELPSAFAEIPVSFIDTKMIKNQNGTLRRPNTGDTIRSWLATQPESGSCLFISNNPYVGYQDSVVRTFMPKGFVIETVGSAVSDDDTKVSVYLDNCARWLYQEKIRRDKGL